MQSTVLLVDDCATTRRLLAFYLKDEPVRILHAENGLEALEYLAREPVHLMITDIYMPMMDGLELIRVMRTDPATASIPVVLLSTETLSDEISQQIPIAVSLTKPIARDRLLAHIRPLLNLIGHSSSQPDSTRTQDQERAHSSGNGFPDCSPPHQKRQASP